MAELLIPNVEEFILARLRDRASIHGTSAEAEAKSILAEALQPVESDAWVVVDAIRERLSASGVAFGDSTELRREDRAR